MKELAH